VSTQEPMSIEDRVRTATQAAATLVRDIGPLPAETEQTRSRRTRRRAPRRWLTWGIPLAAAAAVVLVAVALVAVRGAPTASTTLGRSVTPTKTAAPAPQPASTPVPRYYVAVDQEGSGRTALIVGDDLTGTTVATVSPPSGMTFLSVGGAADDRTFVVSGGSWPDGIPSAWYLLRIAPGSARPYQLATVPIKLAGGSDADILAYALSPDATKLAVESQQASRTGGAAVTTLAIYSTSSGAEQRAWTTSAYSQFLGYPDTLTWLDGGRELAFSHIPPGSHLRSGGNGADQNQVRALDLTGDSSDLLAASRVVLTLPEPSSSSSTCNTLNLTPDGTTVICATQYDNPAGRAAADKGCADRGLEFIAYSARTGKPVRILGAYGGPCNNGQSFVLWTGSSANAVITTTVINPGNQGGPEKDLVVVISDGHFRLLKLAAGVTNPAPLGLAF
jgi:hypothetical protein